MGKLIVLDHTGHTTVEWDPAVEEEARKAAAAFAEIIERNYGFAYTPVKENPGKYTQIREFDSEVEEIIIRGPLVGG